MVGTNHNHGAIQLSIARAAEGLIEGGEEQPPEPVLNQIEMAFRAYDPCFACATHALPGRMPLEVRLHDARRGETRVITREPDGRLRDSREVRP